MRKKAWMPDYDYDLRSKLFEPAHIMKRAKALACCDAKVTAEDLRHARAAMNELWTQHKRDKKRKAARARRRQHLRGRCLKRMAKQDNV